MAIGLVTLFESTKGKQVVQSKSIGSSEVKTEMSKMESHLVSGSIGFMEIKKNISRIDVRKEKVSVCFHCDEKYSNGHKCKKLFIIEAIWEEEDEYVLINGE